MLKRIKKLLADIQNSDEATKKHWLIGVSAASMVLVIGLWLAYIKLTFKFSDINIENQEPVVGFWQIFKNGLMIIIQFIKENIKNFILEITRSRTIIIE